MSVNDVVQLITVIGTFLTALGIPTIIMLWVKNYLKERQQKIIAKKSFTNIFNNSVEIVEILQQILNGTNADRVVLLRTKNGGGTPKLGAKLYSSVLHESFTKELEPVREKWQNQLLDNSYILMLYELNNKGKLRISTEEEKDYYYLKKGMLRMLYLKDNIRESWVYKIAEQETQYVYLSINFKSKQKYDSVVSDLLRHSISRLQFLFSSIN